MGTCELRDALNGNLPEDCHVNLVEETDSNFHARFSALHRDYIYSCRQDRYLLDRNTVWYTCNLDLSKLNNAACLLYTSPSPRDLSTSRMPSSA